VFRIFGSQNYVKGSVIGYGLCVCSLYSVSTAIVKLKGKGKGKGNTKTSHKDKEGELRYSSILSSTSALEGAA
jgi:hypothetical protein